MISVVILLASMVTLECHGYVHMISMKLYEHASLKNDSFFGFSIAYQPGIQRLIISAPHQDDIGTIYTTGMDPSKIVKLPLESYLLSRSTKITNDFWFGATVKANSKFFVACAPRYAETKSNKPKKDPDRLQLPATMGICIQNKYIGADKYKSENVPIMTSEDRRINAKTFEKQMDTMGWNIDITESDKVLISSPAMMTVSYGILLWGGAVDINTIFVLQKRAIRAIYNLGPRDSLRDKFKEINVLRVAGRVLLYNSIVSTPHLMDGKIPKNLYSYNLGYSLTSGSFFNKNMVYVISSTFGKGKVFFLDSQEKYLKFIEGSEVGSMFGAALCAARLGASALLVGAPTYSDNAYKPDIGAVNVYVDQTDELMHFKRIIKGPSSGSYFGHAIENLGDIDGDEKDEIVIAAPFENGNGAVYIYSGASILDEKTPPIRIQPKPFQSFGFSLAILEDTDGNGSNELAVGSPLDNKVVVFKTFASIRVILSAELNPKVKDSDKDFVLKYCIETYLKQKNITSELIVVIELTSAIFTRDPSKNRVLKTRVPLLNYIHQNKSCEEHEVHVQTDELNTSANKLIMSYNITASLDEDPQKMADFDPSRVLLSEALSVLNVQGNKWNPDKSIDEPDLSLNISSSMTEPYLIGSSHLESVTLLVENTGGAASKSCIQVSVEGAPVVGYPQSCTHDADLLLCRHNQIIKNDSVWENVFQIDTNYLTSTHKSLIIRCDLYPQCGHENKTSQEKTIELKPYNNMVKINGQSNPDRFVNMTTQDLQMGKALEHVYTIYNYGLTNWVGVKSEIVLKRSSFIDYSKTPIKVYTDTYSNGCGNASDTEDDIIRVWCDIGNMKKQEKVIVVIAIEIEPGNLEFESDDQTITITTSLNLWLQDELKHFSLDTTLKYAKAEVPLWVTLTSSFVGIFILIILSYILYEYGFLRRKTKDKLIKKKADYRESVRRSMICESIREQISRRQERLNQLQTQEDEDTV